MSWINTIWYLEFRNFYEQILFSIWNSENFHERILFSIGYSVFGNVSWMNTIRYSVFNIQYSEIFHEQILFGIRYFEILHERIYSVFSRIHYSVQLWHEHSYLAQVSWADHVNPNNANQNKLNKSCWSIKLSKFSLSNYVA